MLVPGMPCQRLYRMPGCEPSWTGIQSFVTSTKLPDPHCTQQLSTPNLLWVSLTIPIADGQVVSSSARMLPTQWAILHSSTEAAISSENMLSGHAVHLVAPESVPFSGTEKRPVGHPTHALVGSLSWSYVPAAHAPHTKSPGVHAVPGAQHSAGAEIVPLLQATGSVELPAHSATQVVLSATMLDIGQVPPFVVILPTIRKLQS